MRARDTEFNSAGACLSGTVWSPDYPVAAPGVVLVGGSGPTTRTNAGYFDRLRDALVGAGVVVFSYDKRGTGHSTGEWASATVEELAADARFAVQVLSDLPGVDHQRVGIFGHSEGGWVALRACATARCSFLIMNACPAVPFIDAEIHALVIADVEPPHARGLYAGLQFAARAGVEFDAANRLVAKLENRRLRVALDEDGFTLDTDRWAQLRSWIDYTPEPDLCRLAVPTLAIYGGNDPLTPIQASQTALTRLAPSARSRVFADADHRVQIDGDFAPGYFDTIIGWCIEPPSETADALR